MKTELPPGPKSLFIETVRYATSKDLLKDLLDLSRRYGDPMSFPSPGGTMVITSDPAGIKAIFSADPDSFVPATDSALASIVGEGSIFMLGGAAHKRARKLLSPPFNGERMRAYGSVMRDTTARWIARWEPEGTFTMIETMQSIALDVIIEAIFGVHGQEEVARHHKAVVDTLTALTLPIAAFPALRREFLGMGPWARFQRCHGALKEMIYKEIAGARAAEGREDILSLLVKARDDEGQGLSDQEIFEQLLTLLVAGHETTAVTLSWAFYLLHQNPEVLGRLREELSPLGREPDPEKLAKNAYLDAVCQETMRHYPVLGIIMRKLGRPFTLLGYELPAGLYVGVNTYMAHRREETFPEPSRFSPERFLGKSYSPFEFLPFGGGMRRCLGAPFALYEMKIVLATVLLRCRLELREKKPVTVAMRAATMGPRGGVRMGLKEKL